MKKWAFLLLVTFGVAIAEGEITVNVYEADGVTPFADRDIMVGTKLTITVSSDDDGYWSGGLFITGQDRALAELTARGWDPDTQDWMSSRYDTAGENALVWDYYDSLMWGFDLYTDSNAVAGDWFVIDYTAMEIGDPNVGFYDYNVSWDDAISLICFSHIPTRDFNEDKIVNLVDYDLLASHWLATDCSDPCWCGQTDINTDGNVNFADLILFTEYWLWTAPDWVLVDNFSENNASSLPMTMATSEIPETQESEIYQPTQELSIQDIEEIVASLEELWIENEEVKEMYSEAEWQEFIDSVKAHIDGSN